MDYHIGNACSKRYIFLYLFLSGDVVHLFLSTRTIGSRGYKFRAHQVTSVIMSISSTSSQAQFQELIKSNLSLRDILREKDSLSRIETTNRVILLESSSDESISAPAKQKRPCQPPNHKSSSCSKQTLSNDVQDSEAKCRSLRLLSKKQRDGHSFVLDIQRLQTSRQQSLMINYQQRTNILTNLELPIFVPGLFHRQASHSSKHLHGPGSGQASLNHLPVAIQTSEVFEGPISAPDFNINQLWEEVREKISLTGQVSSKASEVMAQTSDIFAKPIGVRLSRVPIRKGIDKSRLSIMLGVSNVIGKPQVTDGLATESKPVSVVDTSAEDDRSTFELFELIVPSFDKEVNGLLGLQQESQEKKDDEQIIHDPTCLQLHHLRFRDFDVRSDSVRKRTYSLDIADTFRTFKGYPDIIAPSAVFGPNNMGGSFLSALEMPGSIFEDFSFYWEEDALESIMTQLRMHRILELSQKRAFVDSLHHLCYEISPYGYVRVSMMSIKTISDSVPSAALNSAAKLSCPAAVENLRGSEKQSLTTPEAIHDKLRLLQQPSRRLGRKDRHGSFNAQSVSTAAPLANNRQASEPTGKSSNPSVCLKEATPDSGGYSLPCYHQLVSNFNLHDRHERAAFSELNIAVMKWGQARFGMGLAEQLHKLRERTSNQEDWSLNDLDLQNFWKDVIYFKTR